MKNKSNVYNIVFTAIMAGIVCVVTFYKFPLLGSNVHFANAMCLLAGLLFGSKVGGMAAGLGSAFYDFYAGYDFINVLITFFSKFAMSFVCAKVAGTDKKPATAVKATVASVIGALTYVALYMLKTFVYQKFVYGFEMSAVTATMFAKLIPSLINALVAFVAAPILYKAIEPAIRKLK